MIWRRMRVPLACLLVYGLTLVIFTVALPHDGLVSPDGKLDCAGAAATVLVMCLRMAVLFVLVPFSAYRLVAAVTSSWLATG